MLCAQENGFRNRVAVGQYKRYNIKIKLSSGSLLGGVRVWRAGPFFIHTLQLRFKQKIFMIFIVDHFCKKGFLKIEKKIILGLPFSFIIDPFLQFPRDTNPLNKICLIRNHRVKSQGSEYLEQGRKEEIYNS